MLILTRRPGFHGEANIDVSGGTGPAGDGEPDTVTIGNLGDFGLGGINFVLCDGSVRTVSRSIDMTLFEHLTTIGAGDDTSGF